MVHAADAAARKRGIRQQRATAAPVRTRVVTGNRSRPVADPLPATPAINPWLGIQRAAAAAGVETRVVADHRVRCLTDKGAAGSALPAGGEWKGGATAAGVAPGTDAGKRVRAVACKFTSAAARGAHGTAECRATAAGVEGMVVTEHRSAVIAAGRCSTETAGLAGRGGEDAATAAGVGNRIRTGERPTLTGPGASATTTGGSDGLRQRPATSAGVGRCCGADRRGAIGGAGIDALLAGRCATGAGLGLVGNAGDGAAARRAAPAALSACHITGGSGLAFEQAATAAGVHLRARADQRARAVADEGAGTTTRRAAVAGATGERAAAAAGVGVATRAGHRGPIGAALPVRLATSARGPRSTRQRTAAAAGVGRCGRTYRAATVRCARVAALAAGSGADGTGLEGEFCTTATSIGRRSAATGCVEVRFADVTADAASSAAALAGRVEKWRATTAAIDGGRIAVGGLRADSTTVLTVAASGCACYARPLRQFGAATTGIERRIAAAGDHLCAIAAPDAQTAHRRATLPGLPRERIAAAAAVLRWRRTACRSLCITLVAASATGRLTTFAHRMGERSATATFVGAHIAAPDCICTRATPQAITTAGRAGQVVQNRAASATVRQLLAAADDGLRTVADPTAAAAGATSRARFGREGAKPAAGVTRNAAAVAGNPIRAVANRPPRKVCPFAGAGPPRLRRQHSTATAGICPRRASAGSLAVQTLNHAATAAGIPDGDVGTGVGDEGVWRRVEPATARYLAILLRVPAGIAPNVGRIGDDVAPGVADRLLLGAAPSAGDQEEQQAGKND